MQGGEIRNVRISLQKPTVDEVRAYCTERRNTIDPEEWIDHYESNGWMVGRNRMKDWRAAVRTWERRGARDQQQQPSKPRTPKTSTAGIYEPPAKWDA